MVDCGGAGSLKCVVITAADQLCTSVSFCIFASEVDSLNGWHFSGSAVEVLRCSPILFLFGCSVAGHHRLRPVAVQCGSSAWSSSTVATVDSLGTVFWFSLVDRSRAAAPWN